MTPPDTRLQATGSDGAAATPEEVTETIRRRIPTTVLRLIVLALGLAFWEWILPLLVDDFFVSRPSAVLSQLGEWIGDGSLFSHMGVTFTELGLGFVFGAAGGLVVGILFGLSRRLSEVFEPFILGLYSMPKIALMPLFIVWFGLGMQPKVVLAGVLVFFIVFFNTLSGVLDVDEELIDVVSVMGASRFDRVRRVIVPSALTWIFAGMRISIPQAFSGAVAGELISSSNGLGYLIVHSSAQFNTAGVFAGLTVLVVLGAALGIVLRWIENSVVAWKRPEEQNTTSVPL